MVVVENGIRARDMVMFRMALPPVNDPAPTTSLGSRPSP
jgi:hypothetical protein